MARKIVDYSDFSGGEFGILEPWRAPPGTWTGLNMTLYDNGSLGPRNGLVKIPLSEPLPGIIASAGPFSTRSASRMWVIFSTFGSNIRVVDRDGTVHAVTLVDSVPTPAEPVMSVNYEATEYLSFVSSGLYALDDTGSDITFTKVPDAPGCRAFIKYGERFMAGGGDVGGVPIGPDGGTSPANRLWYSEPGDPTDWPTLNYIDLTGAIVGLYPQRTHLVIITTEGWWILTGVPGVNETLRRQTIAEFPTWPTMATTAEPSGNIVFVQGSMQARDGEDPVTPDTPEGELSIHSLAMFTGSQFEYASHLPFGNGQNYTFLPPPTYQVVSMRGPDDWLVQGGLETAPNQAVWYRSKAWQRIFWQTPAVEGDTPMPFTPLLGWCIAMRRTDRHQFWSFMTNELFEWQPYNNRPAFVSDVRKQPGDGSTTPFDAWFELPEWHSEDGSDAGMVDIVVDFTSWDTGAGNNHFEIVPTVLRTFGETDAQVGETLTFDEAGSESATTVAGTRRRLRFQGVARGLEGSGFQLRVQNIRGVAINRIRVLVDTDGPMVGE